LNYSSKMGIGRSYLKNYLDTGADEQRGRMSSVSSPNASSPLSQIYGDENTPRGPGHDMPIVDPRSPNVEISRTPIVVKVGEEKTSGGDRDRLARKLLVPRQIVNEVGRDDLTPTSAK